MLPSYETIIVKIDHEYGTTKVEPFKYSSLAVDELMEKLYRADYTPHSKRIIIEYKKRYYRIKKHIVQIIDKTGDEVYDDLIVVKLVEFLDPIDIRRISERRLSQYNINPEKVARLIRIMMMRIYDDPVPTPIELKKEYYIVIMKK